MLAVPLQPCSEEERSGKENELAVGGCKCREREEEEKNPKKSLLCLNKTDCMLGCVLLLFFFGGGEWHPWDFPYWCPGA